MKLSRAVPAVFVVALGVLGVARRSHTQTTPPARIKTVWIILMENQNWSQILGSKSAPYINSLLPIASHAEQYYNPPEIHPSLPNYLWLEGGANFGILDDGDPRTHSETTTQHLVTLLKNKGISWKSYQEDITGTACPLVSSSLYAAKHDPFVYFDDVTNNLNPKSASCIAHVRPFTEMAKDISNGNVAQYNFITPNLCDDMHDKCKPNRDQIQQGDVWLHQNLPAILNSSAYKTGGAVFITWDEAGKGDGPIGMIVLSPFAKGNGYRNSIHYDHGSTLRTMEEIFGVTPLLNDAAKQRDLSDLFAVFP